VKLGCTARTLKRCWSRSTRAHIAATDLDWAIVRPGTLTDAPGTGKVRLGLPIPYGEVPRYDVAAVLAELVHAPEARRVILELTSGDVPPFRNLMKAMRMFWQEK
jgi:uncharacterized protein YbjT (DUF2867 family)